MNQLFKVAVGRRHMAGKYPDSGNLLIAGRRYGTRSVAVARTIALAKILDPTMNSEPWP